MATYYVLRDKGTLRVSCVSRSTEELDKKIHKAFWNWRAVQSKGSDKSIDDFMEGHVKTKMVIEDIA